MIQSLNEQDTTLKSEVTDFRLKRELLTLRHDYAWLILVAPIFLPRYNMDVGAQKFVEAYLFCSLSFGFKRTNLGHLRGGFSVETMREVPLGGNTLGKMLSWGIRF